MKASERFLKYVTVHTTSDPALAGEKQPSTARQFDLARLLVEEMRALGIEDARVDEWCYVYGSIPASPGLEAKPAIGLVAHMDTSPDASGENVKPNLIENYDGGDVALPNGRVIPLATFPELAALKGETLITAGGDTLLGADDKAGIAEILTACEEILRGNIPHGKICVAFTPDEEIGAGTDHFDVPGFGAHYAYTLDGGPVEEVEYETFNAAAAALAFTGTEVHPGSAKDIMVNAARLAVEFDTLLPAAERPENTEGRQGFYHLTQLRGNVAAAEACYIIRDHDRALLEARKQALRQAAAELERRHGPGRVRLKLEDSYYNMGQVIERHFHLVENARRAVRAVGLEPVTNATRGGTDGSRLSVMGLPCPNLGTGGHYFHGPNECITAEAMDQAVRVILEVLRLYAEGPNAAEYAIAKENE